MKHLERFSEGVDDLVKITLPRSEYKLLIKLLKDLEDRRSDDNCNDPDKSEERLFTKKERMDINLKLAEYRYISKQDAEDNEDFLYSHFFAAYLYHKLKNI